MDKAALYHKQWQRCLDVLKVNTDKQTYETWFAPIVFDSMDEQTNTITLRILSNYIYETLESDRKLKSLLYSVLWAVFNEKLQIRYRVLTDSTSGTTTDKQGTAGTTSEAKSTAEPKR